MKRTMVFLFFLLNVFLGNSQEIATTESGKIVELREDGTWHNIEIPKNDSTGFRKVLWGSTKENVKENENIEIAHEDEDAIFYKTSLNGLDCSVIYIFTENKLVRGRYYFDNEHSNKSDYIYDFTEIKELLTQKYGQPIDDQQVWKKDIYKDDVSDWGMAIATGGMYYFSIWETKDTKIQSQLWGDNFEITHTIDYTSKILGYLEAHNKKQETIDNL